MKRICLMLLAGLAGSTAHAGIFDDTEARKMILELQKQNQEQDARYQALQERLVKLEAQFKNLRLIDLFNQLEATRDDVNKLRGQLEVQTHQIDTTQKRQKDFYVDLDGRLRQLETSSTTDKAAEPASGPTSANPGAGTDKPPVSDPQTAGEVASYDVALAGYKTGKYEEAIRSFSAFLKQYPESKLAANALYWIAMSQSALRDYKTAISTQQKLLNLFPDGSKAPDALFNIGQNQLELGDKKAARKTFSELITRFPIAPAADKARRLVNTLK